jgi:SAM-dependent methyltransferase
VIRDRRRSEESRQLEPAVAVGRAHHGNLNALVAQPGDTPGPFSFDRSSPFELEAELATEIDHRREVVDDYPDVIHPSKRHVTLLRETAGPQTKAGHERDSTPRLVVAFAEWDTGHGIEKTVGGESTMMRRLFAAMYDTVSKGSEAAGMRDERRRLLAAAEGATLELGAGTGLNLEHYPEAVTRLVLTEPDRHMRVRLGRRVEALSATAEIIDAPAEQLPFADATFDTAVATWVLCSVPDQQAALQEVARVLKPNGRLLFLEHVRSDDPKVARWQDRIKPIYNLVGCSPNRKTLAAIEASALAIESVRHGEVPKAPKLERPMIVGIARR